MADRPYLGAVTPEFRAQVMAARDIVLNALAAADIRGDVGLTALALILVRSSITEGVSFAQVVTLIMSHWMSMNGPSSKPDDLVESLRQAGILVPIGLTGAEDPGRRN